MERRTLGSTGSTVSRLGLGTATWGRATGEDDAFQQLRVFVDAGGTLVDASDADGPSASLLGTLIADPGLRARVFLAARTGPTWSATPPHRSGPSHPVDSSRRAIRRSIDSCLATLGVDHVDLWLLQGIDSHCPLDETLGALAEVVHSGRAHYAGLSSLAGWQLSLAVARGWQSPHHLTFAAASYEYSLLQRGIEAEVVPACGALGLGILPCAPLGAGVLTGKYRHGTPPDSRGASEAHGAVVRTHLGARGRAIVEGVARAAEGLGVSPAEIAISWVRDRPGVVAPLIGARTVHQLRTALAADSLDLPAEIRSALDELSAPVVSYPARDDGPANDSGHDAKETGAWARATNTAN